MEIFEGAEEIGELLKEIQQQQRLFLLLVTHSNELARSLDFVYEMLPGGKLVPADKKSASLSAQS